MVDKPIIIGHHEQIDIVDHAVSSIPAKIDTGADGSSIWASNIVEHQGTLSFTLFGAGSVYYTGQVLQTNKYRVTSVKNSFGESERRFIVTLSIRIAEKRYKVRFTLSDRSRSNFPVLLGKRFLNRKFLVDVSRKHILTANKRTGALKVLVLGSTLDQKRQAFFAEVAKYAQAQIDVYDYSQLIFSFGIKPRVDLLTAAGPVDIASYDLVYFKSRGEYTEIAMTVGRYLHYHNINYIDSELGQLVSNSKLSQMMQLQTFGLPVPDGVVANHKVLLQRASNIVDQLGWPLIVKDVFSDRGQNNYLVNSLPELQKILKKADASNLFVIQKYIPNNGYSRVLVLGKEAKLVISRLALKSDQQKADPQKHHLNNVIGGANASLQPVSTSDATMVSLSQKAADVMRRQVAGVDILQDKDSGKWYILEVNSSPQLLTKRFSQEKAQAMGEYLKREAERWYL